MNFLKVKRFQRFGFNCQPAPLHLGAKSKLDTDEYAKLFDGEVPTQTAGALVHDAKCLQTANGAEERPQVKLSFPVRAAVVCRPDKPDDPTS